MSLENISLISVLQANNHSITNPRQVVFGLLERKGPLTMHELTDALQHTVNRATIYRTIELFEKLGIVKRLQIGWKYKLELSQTFSHHHHLSCLTCNKVVKFEESQALLASIYSVASDNNFSIQDHLLEIRGICPGCLQQNNVETKRRLLT